MFVGVCVRIALMCLRFYSKRIRVRYCSLTHENSRKVGLFRHVLYFVVEINYIFKFFFCFLVQLYFIINVYI